MEIQNCLNEKGSILASRAGRQINCTGSVLERRVTTYQWMLEMIDGWTLSNGRPFFLAFRSLSRLVRRMAAPSFVVGRLGRRQSRLGVQKAKRLGIAKPVDSVAAALSHSWPISWRLRFSPPLVAKPALLWNCRPTVRYHSRHPAATATGTPRQAAPQTSPWSTPARRWPINGGDQSPFYLFNIDLESIECGSSRARSAGEVPWWSCEANARTASPQTAKGPKRHGILKMFLPLRGVEPLPPASVGTVLDSRHLVLSAPI